MNKQAPIIPAAARDLNRTGYLFVILAALFWAASGTMAKYLFHNGITPFQLVQLRLTIAAVTLLAWLGWRAPEKLRINRADIRYFLLLGTFGLAAVQFTYLFAISKIHVAAAILLQYMAPILLAIYSVLFLKERLHRVTVIAVVAATTGCFLVVGIYRVEVLSLQLSGVISGLLSALTFAGWSVYGEYGMRRYDPWTVLFYASAVAAVAWNLLHPPLEAFFHQYPPHIWAVVAAVGVLGTLLPFGFYLEGISRVRATRASITATLEPISAALFSFVLLGETLDKLQISGACLVISAIVLLQLKQEADQRAPHLLRSRSDDKAGQP